MNQNVEEKAKEVLSRFCKDNLSDDETVIIVHIVGKKSSKNRNVKLIYDSDMMDLLTASYVCLDTFYRSIKQSAAFTGAMAPVLDWIKSLLKTEKFITKFFTRWIQQSQREVAN